jgi:hypothetical protein
MIEMNEPKTANNILDYIRAMYEDTLVPLSLDGLEKMFLPDESAFCEIARFDSNQNHHLSGISLRYTAMSLIGLTVQESRGRTTNLPLDKISDRLFAWCNQDISLGDGGLVLWALALRKDPRIEQIVRILIDRAATIPEEKISYSSMGLGWLLTGLSVAIKEQPGPPEMRQLAERVFQQLLRNRSVETGLFSLATPVLRKNIFVGRVNSQLGSFASQVYPIIGLSQYARAQNFSEALDIAQQHLDLLCRLQGSQGQWWWIYRVKTGQPVVKYPVYGVHQDAMGPMALLAARLAGAEGENLLLSVEKSHRWLEDHEELAEEPLIDREKSVVWRAIQRDNPAGTGDFGLGLGERLRMHRAAWLGGSDRREFTKGYVCRESRPYHLGWILYAAALVQELGDSTK